MIEILRPTPQKLEIFSHPIPRCWVNVFLPTPKELDHLKNHYGVPSDLLEELKDPDQISFMEERKDSSFFVLRAPYNDARIPLEYTTVPIGIFVTAEMVITICLYDNEVIGRLKNQRYAFAPILREALLGVSAADPP